jgi:4-oxalocrotonate tautomerase
VPFVHIFHNRDFSQERVEHLGDAVHQALMDTFGVASDDLFQAFSARSTGSQLRVPPAFLGIRHSDDAVFVQITCAPGRTAELKRALFAAIAFHAQAIAHVDPGDVIVNLVESSREKWAFGNGLAQLAA